MKERKIEEKFKGKRNLERRKKEKDKKWKINEGKESGMEFKDEKERKRKICQITYKEKI